MMMVPLVGAAFIVLFVAFDYDWRMALRSAILPAAAMTFAYPLLGGLYEAFTPSAQNLVADFNPNPSTDEEEIAWFLTAAISTALMLGFTVASVHQLNDAFAEYERANPDRRNPPSWVEQGIFSRCYWEGVAEAEQTEPISEDCRGSAPARRGMEHELQRQQQLRSMESGGHRT